ncbi:c-type cytochrome [Deinococcus ficus]|uniref:c-type cytochrome n=1 Tax=Deinococcus ficus TaxID=317577 RepID=UPI0003B7222C|nr:c-type cytochrome [Deinococcus ficus]
MRLLTLTALGLSLLTVASAAPSAAAGKALYTANCAGCHGANAKGVVGPSLKLAATWTPAQFKTALVIGKTPKGVTLKPMMPRFTKGFAPKTGKAPTDDQIRSLQLYIKSLKP